MAQLLSMIMVVNIGILSEEEFNNRTNVELSLEEISEKFNVPLDKLKIKK